MLTVFNGTFAYAAGRDDGIVKIITMDGKRYFCREMPAWCNYYMATDGSTNAFYRYYSADINGDGKTDVRDLVRMKKNLSSNLDTDLNFDNVSNAIDLSIIRRFLLGMPDFEVI